jgi:hypothetical protein
MSDDTLLAACHERSVELLKRNLSPEGILAATPSPHARKRGYTAIFGRDAAVCAIGMALSGDRELQRAASVGLRTLARHQASNGQIPKYVDVDQQEPDFWYLGCIDSTLWWLIALAVLDAHEVAPRAAARVGRASTSAGRGGVLRARYARQIQLAIQWLLAQEHQRFFLLQQNEASDWADIMPRSGFVLYTNALWYHVKTLYRLQGAEATRENFNGLFHPFSAGIAQYKRARLLGKYVRARARSRDLYLSFVNFAFFGDEGDVFGNSLALLLGLADEKAARRTITALSQSAVSSPYPSRAVVRPISQLDMLWRPYMARHGQNLAWQYHNGGIWPMVGGFWIAALSSCGYREAAQRELVKLARACALRNWSFTEWLHGRTLAPRGMPGQSWNAAAFLMAHHAILRRVNPLRGGS